MAFSGGLDSSILAYLHRDDALVLYTIGVKDSVDMRKAAEISKILGLVLKTIEIDEDSIVEGLRALYHITGPMSPVEFSFELPLYFVLKETKEAALCTGQGADELFGGYAKYLSAPDKMEEDLNKLLNMTAPRERKIAEHFKKELRTPYLSTAVVEFASKVPVYCKIRNGTRKWVLREAARRLGAPDIIVNREKKAAQYGSGTWKLMKKMAKKEALRVDEWLLKVIERN